MFYGDSSAFHLPGKGIDAGTMTVVRDGDKHTLTIDFIDCDKAHPHHVRSTFSQDTPINVFGYHP